MSNVKAIELYQKFHILITAMLCVPEPNNMDHGLMDEDLLDIQYMIEEDRA